MHMLIKCSTILNVVMIAMSCPTQSIIKNFKLASINYKNWHCVGLNPRLFSGRQVMFTSVSQAFEGVNVKGISKYKRK